MHNVPRSQQTFLQQIIPKQWVSGEGLGVGVDERADHIIVISLNTDSSILRVLLCVIFQNSCPYSPGYGVRPVSNYELQFVGLMRRVADGA